MNTRRVQSVISEVAKSRKWHLPGIFCYLRIPEMSLNHSYEDQCKNEHIVNAAKSSYVQAKYGAECIWNRTLIWLEAFIYSKLVRPGAYRWKMKIFSLLFIQQHCYYIFLYCLFNNILNIFLYFYYIFPYCLFNNTVSIFPVLFNDTGFFHSFFLSSSSSALQLW